MEAPWYRDQQAVRTAIAEHGSIRAAARATGTNEVTLKKWANIDHWRQRDNAYKRTEKGKAREQRSLQRRISRCREQGLCLNCRHRPAQEGLSRCARCDRYAREYKWLGYSTVPVAIGSDG